MLLVRQVCCIFPSLQCAAVKSQPVQGCAGMKQRAEGTDSSMVWSIYCLEMNSCSLGDCVILSISASHYYILLFLFFIHVAI